MDSGRRGRNLEPKLVLIGVQARTASTRLPNKVMLPIAGKPILDHVLNACEESAKYLNRNFARYGCTVRVVLLVPEGDPLEAKHKFQRRHLVRAGSAEDVLARYVDAAKAYSADYVVRITADCVFTAPYLISRCVKSALFGGYDYVSNVLVRTFREGMDVEVISARLLDWLHLTANTPEAREHVTVRLRDRELVPGDVRFCHVMNDVDDSDLKTSIDTIEDYHRAVAEFDSLASKRRYASQHGDAVS